jgi:hypothetical protein
MTKGGHCSSDQSVQFWKEVNKEDILSFKIGILTRANKHSSKLLTIVDEEEQSEDK